MGLADVAFQKLFSRMFVYNILYEDAEVDERYLGVGTDSTVLSITGAGCGVAGMLSKHPLRIDAVDINRHHLALTALKCTAAQHAADYTDFYDLLGRGWAPDPEATLRGLSDTLPPWIATYWRRHAGRFRGSLYREGLTARMLGAVRRRAGMGLEWARAVAELSVEDRVATLHHTLAPVNTRATRMVLNSPLQLVALGINFQQRDRLVSTEQVTMSDFIVRHLVALMHTDLATNWFFWYGAAGQFDHRRQDAVPPYLRRDRWDSSHRADTTMRYHHGNLFEVLEEAGPDTWSHYTLCDAVDWMAPPVQRQLFEQIRRTARPGAVVLLRSVDAEDPVERVGARWMEKLPCSALASQQDRSRQYRQVNFYQVNA